MAVSDAPLSNAPCRVLQVISAPVSLKWADPLEPESRPKITAQASLLRPLPPVDMPDARCPHTRIRSSGSVGPDTNTAEAASATGSSPRRTMTTGSLCSSADIGFKGAIVSDCEDARDAAPEGNMDSEMSGPTNSHERGSDVPQALPPRRKGCAQSILRPGSACQLAAELFLADNASNLAI
jgi:hypothetical protein